MATTTSTSTTISTLLSLKPQIFRNNNRIRPWNINNNNPSKTTTHNAILLLHSPTTRFSHFPVPLLSHNLHLLPLDFQIRHHNFLSHPYLPPLLRLGSSSFSPPMSSLASSTPPPPDSTPKTVRVMIKGRVQGVFYRNWTVENARELGLNGWVRNRRDGSVEALFSGSDDKVREMEQRCRRGPPSAMVTALDVVPCSDDPGTGFERRPTV